MQIPEDARIPTPAGHYSPIIEHQGLLFVSGQLGMDPATKQAHESIEAQTTQALNNLENLLLAAGSNRNHVLQVRIFIADLELWGQVNESYKEFFGEHKPARAIIPCGKLHYGCLLELEATAYVAS